MRGFTVRCGAPCATQLDPAMVLAVTRLRDETILLYEMDWVAVIQPDGAFEVSRMD